MTPLVPWNPIRKVAANGGEPSAPYGFCMPSDRDVSGIARSSTGPLPGFRLRPSAAGAVPQSVLYCDSFSRERTRYTITLPLELDSAGTDPSYPIVYPYPGIKSRLLPAGGFWTPRSSRSEP